jgi:pimeloyl-ACP methyl ester carboxylesterase
MCPRAARSAAALPAAVKEPIICTTVAAPSRRFRAGTAALESDPGYEHQMGVSPRSEPVASTSAEPLVPALDDPRWRHGFAEVNGAQLHYVEAGAGPLVLLVHGFPEFWYSWRHQILPLAAAGFRVVAPDLRGFNLSDKPRGIAAYGMRTVVDDLRALILSLGAERASVIGHDVGAGVAWAFAMRHPALLVRLGILNGPHPERLLRALLTSRQLLKSWYMFLFQLPWLPEYLVRRRSYALLFQPFDRLPASARWTPYEYEAYRQAFARPGALHAMINYYRAFIRPSCTVALRPIEAEVLILWGERDAYLGRELAQPASRWVPRARVEYFPGAGHFVQQEQPEAVTERLIQFLKKDQEPRVVRA